MTGRLRNVNNHGSKFRARRPILPPVQPQTVDNGNGWVRVPVIVKYSASFFFPNKKVPAFRTGEYVPAMGAPNSSSRRRSCNYKRMQARGIANTEPEGIRRLYSFNTTTV